MLATPFTFDHRPLTSGTSASLSALFERGAALNPDGVAVTFNGTSLTYKELDLRANQLAHHLRTLGIGVESLVGLFHERSADLVVGVLGILKAGAAYVPVDVTNPPERVAAILGDAQVAAVVTQASVKGSLPTGFPLVQLDADFEHLRTLPTSAPAVDVTGVNAAYVIYTSGSTGAPKGVVVTHQNVTRLFESTRQWFAFEATDIWTLFHSIAFDFSVWELWGALLYGGRLVVVPQDVTRSPDRFLALLRDERVTVLNQTPSAFQMLMQADAAAGGNIPLALRYVVFGGEALNFESLRGWFARRGDETPQLINMYGITETTVHVTYRRVRTADLHGSRGSLIGLPIPDLVVYLLDEHRQPVPSGVPGEIFVGGAGVARGYLNRPELTAERFVVDPFAGAAGARMYRSGDSARQTSDGDLEYLGRLDTQVKIRGFRIELGEIETALRALPNIIDACVVARGGHEGEQALFAYYVEGCISGLTSETLRARLATRLPEHMIPTRFIAMERIPLTVNGKVDRRALPEPDRRRPNLNRPLVAPRNPAEVWVARHWAEVLNLDAVGVNDPFFELGGTSVAAVRLLSRLNAELGAELPTLVLFRAPTVADMARILVDEHGDLLQRMVPPSVSVATVMSVTFPGDRVSAERNDLRDRRLRRRLGR